jgi:hypothetical protein
MKLMSTGNFSCPKCRKSIFRSGQMEAELRLDIRRNPMPLEFVRRCQIVCNDCEKKSIANFHWLGVACIFCRSFNTGILHTYALDEEAPNLPGKDDEVEEEDEDDEVEEEDEDDDVDHDFEGDEDAEDGGEYNLPDELDDLDLD